MHQQQTQAAMASSYMPTTTQSCHWGALNQLCRKLCFTVLWMGDSKVRKQNPQWSPEGTEKVGMATATPWAPTTMADLTSWPPPWKQKQQQTLSPGTSTGQADRAGGYPAPWRSAEAGREFSRQTLCQSDVLCFCKTQHVSEITLTHIQIWRCDCVFV